MPSLPSTRKRIVAAVSTAVGLAVSLSACSRDATPATPPPPHTYGLPDAHVHGLSVNGTTGQLLLATHDGLYDVSKNPAAKIGSTNDLMGFTAAGSPEILYASGHPGQGSVDPDPLGLIASIDLGKTWEPLSRQGKSDFHALTTTRSGIVAFDGDLLISPDGKSWKSVSVDFHPAALAGHSGSDTVLATVPDGLRRSTDGGATWSKVQASPVIQFAAFASAQNAVGVAPDGTVYRSDDGGSTWTAKGRPSGSVQAVTATQSADDNVRIWVATADGLEVSTDGGLTFASYSPGSSTTTAPGALGVQR